MNDQYKQIHQLTATVGFFVISAWAMTISLPLRRYSGKDYMGIPGIVGLFLIPFYAIFANAPELMKLLPVYLFAMFLHLAGQVKLKLQGVVQHTRYDGDPWVARMLLFCKDEHKCKLVGEPLLAIGAGWFFTSTSEALGLYFFTGAMAMVFVQAMADRHHQRRIDEIHNGRIENEYLMTHVQQQRHSRRRR